MSLAIWLVTAISTTTATGVMSRSMATFGIRAKLRLPGLLTATAIGTGSALGAGPGLTIRPGVSRPTTTAAGIISEAGGAGALGRIMAVGFTGRPLSAFSAAGLVPESAGSRLAFANRFTRGTTAVADTSETSIPAILSYVTRTCSTTPMFATSIT